MSPEGRSPMMFPMSEEDTIRPNPALEFEYSEGLFTSYRNPKAKALFPFGHGLSYTTFEFGAASLVADKCSAAVCAELTLTNKGKLAGTEVAQAYLEFETAKDTPSRMLRGFYKTSLLQPGESEVARFEFSDRDLSIWQVGVGWVVQADIKAHFGASVGDIRQVLRLKGG
eukprot:gnl/TRDRNA2_/TRDRNA2_164720_c1_seq1.p1 gnl/TRDRNA2_/TRDRNA2_164720_c1~~gnl/TRDRNA2_/TRDRNA2_164720_c1_seq1.p1  ORF type:complete len:170 (-),score=27.10 gnl/TRDRNA2_/TRDRNA2_164720_c1_seq1:289-798(-)